MQIKGKQSEQLSWRSGAEYVSCLCIKVCVIIGAKARDIIEQILSNYFHSVQEEAAFTLTLLVNLIVVNQRHARTGSGKF